MINAGRMMRQSTLWTSFCLTLVTSTIRADDFVFKDGRKITGQVVNKFGTILVVELSAGSMLMIDPQELKVHPQNRKGEAAYAEASKTASDTIESHMQMASTARKCLMPDHEKAHYERVLDLDSEHAVARAALGYVKNKDGRWILRDEQMREGRGKVSAGGNRYRFPELVMMEEAEEKFTSERDKLVNEIRRAMGNLTNPRNSAKAQAVLDGLEGPIGSAAIAQVLYPSAKSVNRASAAHKALFIPILERIGDGTSIQTLIRICLDVEPGPEQSAVRQQALGVLKKLAPEAAFHGFIGALSSSNNASVNLAGELLQELGDERALLPLIERLMSTDRVKTGGSKATNAGMSNGNAGFSSGDPVVVRTVNIENPGVLSALVTISGQNYSYDKVAWLRWYEQNYAAFSGDLRRDP